MTAALFHYSTALHLPFILASGELQPSRSDSHGSGHRGVLWFSTNAQIERTVIKRLTNQAFSPPYIRWTVTVPEAQRWPTIGRAAGYRQHTVRGLEQAGRAMGALPGEWWGQLAPLSLERATRLELRVGSRWLELDEALLDVAPVQMAGLEGVRLLAGGYSVCDVARVRAPDGCWAYATNTALARFDGLLTAARTEAIVERARALG